MAFPFVLVQVNTNNQNFSGAGTSSSSSNNAADNSGAFDSLINEYASSDVAKFSVSAQDNKNLNAQSSQQNTLSRPVSQNVLDILAYQVNLNSNLNLNNINSEQLNDLIAEFNEINNNLNNLNLDDENSKLLLANIAEKIISSFSDKLSVENREKLSALAAGLKSYLAVSNSQNSLNSLNSANYISSANLISQDLQDLSGSSLNNNLSNLISGMSEAEIQSELAKTVQDVLNSLGLNLSQSQNQAASQAEGINYNKALYDHKINFNANNENNDNKEPVSDDEDNKENDGGANAKAEHSKLNYEYNYAVLNSVVNQGAAESQPAFFTQDTAQQPELISSDYSASQTLTSTSELSSSSSITASTTSSTSLKSQNARSSQSIKGTDGGDLKNVRINSQNTDGENAAQRTANSTGTGTANSGNSENKNENENENNANKNNEQNLNNQDGNIFNNRRNANAGRTQGNNNSQLDRDDNLNNHNRVENSRQDFQSFFEGVLNNRRTASRIEPAPLNLRPDNNYNYSRSETLRDGIVNVVRFTRADGNYRANMIVDPPALGRITVELTSNTSGVEASIKVVNEQVRQLVQDQITQLRMTLEQQGVQVTQFAVDVQQDNAGRQQNAEQQDRRNNRRTGAIDAIGGMDDENTSEFRIDLEDGLLYWVA